MIPIIGGKLDRQESPLRVPTFEAEGETYILMEYKEKLTENKWAKHRFYMITPGIPLEAIKVYKIRKGLVPK